MSLYFEKAEGALLLLSDIKPKSAFDIYRVVGWVSDPSSNVKYPIGYIVGMAAYELGGLNSMEEGIAVYTLINVANDWHITPDAIKHAINNGLCYVRVNDGESIISAIRNSAEANSYMEYERKRVMRLKQLRADLF